MGRCGHVSPRVREGSDKRHAFPRGSARRRLPHGRAHARSATDGLSLPAARLGSRRRYVPRGASARWGEVLVVPAMKRLDAPMRPATLPLRIRLPARPRHIAMTVPANDARGLFFKRRLGRADAFPAAFGNARNPDPPFGAPPGHARQAGCRA